MSPDHPGRMPRRSVVARMVAIVALFAAVVAAGCTRRDPVPTSTPTSGERQPVELRSDADLDAKIDNLRAKGGSAPLRDLTGFAWDRVYCYYEGSPADKVNGEVGATVLKPGTYLLVSGALAVFVKDGKVVRSLVIRELTFDRTDFDSTVLVIGGTRLAAPPP